MKNTLKKNLLLILLIGVIPLQALSQENPKQVVEHAFALLKKYDSHKAPSLQKKARDEINGYFMLREIGLDAIKDHWSEMSPSQQKTYADLMFKLLLKTIYDDTGDKIKKGYVVIHSARYISKKRYIVPTSITVKKNNLTVANNYGMLQLSSGEWKIRDIFIDGANLAQDYKSQFNKIITTSGFDKTPQSLFPRLRKAIEKTNDWTKLDSDKDKKKKKLQKKLTKKRPTLIEG